MKAILFTIILSLSLHAGAAGQSRSIDLDGTAELYKIEADLIAGNKRALFRLTEYFDSTKKVIDYLGYHRIETTEAEVAKRMIQENCFFTPSEIVVSKDTTKREFIEFLKKKESALFYSADSGAYFDAPLESRGVEFEVLEISPSRKEELSKKVSQLLKLDWVKQDGIDSLVEARDPAALLKIAFHMFRMRNRWNRYYFKTEDDLGLLEHLTGTQIAVKNEKGQFSYHIDSDYSPDSRLNLLIFFAKFHKEYMFDDARKLFINSNLPIKPKTGARIFFEGLFTEDDAKAFEAFIKLTELDPGEVGRLADEYERAHLITHDANRSLPTFPFRFLKQLSLLTDYCRKNGIDYKGSEKVRSYVESLKKEMPYSERYRLENKIIRELSLDDITAFEYWSLIYESEWDLTYSAGRILDKTYGRYWDELLRNDKSLTLYLKKSKLFDNIGIIGAVNKYLDKFIAAPQPVVTRLKVLKTAEKDISDQLALALKNAADKVKEETPGKEKIDVPADLEAQLRRFAGIRFLDEDEKKELVTLLSRISYEQIPMAVTYLEKISFIEASRVRSKYEFLTDDWGFDLVGDFDDDDVRKEFLANYSKMSQSELYSFYLSRNGFDFRKPNNSLDFDKIYDMLKYDVVEAFVGGGGGRRDQHVYSLVKLLENRFGTTLGYINKLCMSRNVFGCNSGGRADAWMRYLRNNKLLADEDKEPVSFTYRD